MESTYDECSSIESDDYLPKARQIFNNRYILLNKLGSGAFSTVWKCQDNVTDLIVALKIHKSSESCSYAAKREANILSKINHPNIIRLYDMFIHHDPQPTTIKYVCLVFELCDCDLSHFMINFTEYNSIKKIIRDILIALRELHKCKIIHTDLKPENILLNGDIAKITDFGTSDWEYRISQEIVGTRYFRAPEMIVKLNLTTAIDIWAVGCILFEMCTGDVLFHPHTYNNWSMTSTEDHIALIIELMGPFPKWMQNGIRGQYLFGKNGKLKNIKELLYWPLERVLFEKYKINDLELVELLNGMLAIDPNKRWSSEKCIDHNWLMDPSKI